MKLKKCVGIFLFSTLCLNVGAIDHKRITFDRLAPDRFTLMENGVANEILVDEQEDAGVMIAVRNLQNDFKRVSGRAAGLCYTPGVKRMIMVGTLKSRYIRELVKAKKIDASLLEGKNEKYLMTVVSAPLNGVNEALVIAGSDKRGTIYGIYELSEQIGVSPWYDWADVPVMPRQNLSMMRGSYTAGEPAVKYRGIFLNDEAPCLTGWVKHTYGTNYGDHRFYARVFELILRLRGNFMWPAMWGWSFYADDPENSKTAMSGKKRRFSPALPSCPTPPRAFSRRAGGSICSGVWEAGGSRTTFPTSRAWCWRRRRAWLFSIAAPTPERTTS